ncbi:MAG: hypothetical protein ACRCYR_03895 [Phycicoccus sp.]
MDRTQKTIAIGGAGIAAAVALGLGGASLANASGTTSVTTHYGYGGYGPVGGKAGGGMRAGGTLTEDAAGKAVAAAAAEVDGGTVNGVRALSDGTYVVDVTTSDGTHVHVLLDKAFDVTSVEERGADGPGGRGGHGGRMPGGEAPGDGGTRPGSPSPSPSTTSTSSAFTT